MKRARVDPHTRRRRDEVYQWLLDNARPPTTSHGRALPDGVLELLGRLS